MYAVWHGDQTREKPMNSDGVQGMMLHPGCATAHEDSEHSYAAQGDGDVGMYGVQTRKSVIPSIARDLGGWAADPPTQIPHLLRRFGMTKRSEGQGWQGFSTTAVHARPQ